MISPEVTPTEPNRTPARLFRPEVTPTIRAFTQPDCVAAAGLQEPVSSDQFTPPYIT